MPRNSSGVYSLPAGNPVTSFTVITTAWANPTMADIGNELTNSLDRSGRGGMLAPFRIFDGTSSQPGLGFLNEVGLGIWRETAGLFHLVNSGVDAISIYPSKVVFPVSTQIFIDAQYRELGVKNWQVSNRAGIFTIAPSTAVDGETWDYTKAMTINPDTGAPSFPTGTMPYLPLAGGTLTGLFTVQYNSAVIKLVDTLHGGSLMIYSDAVTEMVLDCFATATPTTKRPIWLNKYGGNVNLATSGGAGR